MDPNRVPYRVPLAALLLALTSAYANAGEPWRHPLSCARGGYWRSRVPVRVENISGQDLTGHAIELPVGRGPQQIDLVGRRADAVRMCDAKGNELLFDVRGPVRESRRGALLAAGDTLQFCVDCPKDAAAQFWVYFDNPLALRVPDFLSVGLVNPGFEAGEHKPEGWLTWAEDAHHRTAWATERPHSGNRCSKTTVDEGAAPAWVTTSQRNLPITPGRKYRLRGWVRAERVKGYAGWYIHVNGDRPMLISHILRGGDGTFDWREVAFEFTAPETATHANLGTVLRGEGVGWYDDVSMQALDAMPSCRIMLRATETMALADSRTPREWNPGPDAAAQWPCRVEVRAHNFTDRVRKSVLVEARLNAALWRASRGREAVAHVVDPASGRALPHVRLDNRVLFAADLPAKGLSHFHVYLSPNASISDAPDSLAGLVRSQANLAQNGDFERADTLSPWRPFPEGSGSEVSRIASCGKIGPRCTEVRVPAALALAWRGWSQYRVPVRPNTAYFYAGYVRTQGVTDGHVQMHGHFSTADDKRCSRPFFSAGARLAGDNDWTLCSTVVSTPPDCATVNLHLTLSAHGTVWHDGVVFCEIERADAGAIEWSMPAAAAGRDFEVWEVNPLVKVFLDDPPGEPARRIRVDSARNELEPFQLVARPHRALSGFHVTVSRLLHAQGAALPEIQVDRVGYVYVDHPGAFHRSDLPDWYRRALSQGTNSDGWPGDWPDPLPPLAKCDLPKGRNAPLWFTVRVPADARPGEYRGQVTLSADNARAVTLPVVVNVWDFALPKVSTLRVIFDLREGPWRGVFRGPDPDRRLRTWYKMLADHRVSPGMLRPLPKLTYENGKVSLDFAEYDEMACYCFDELGMNVMYAPWFFYSFGWAYTPRKFCGLEPFTPEYDKAFADAYRLFMAHMKAKGWYDRIVYYVSDEPHFRHAHVLEQMKKICDLAHAADPGVPIYSSTWRHTPEWNGRLDIWGVGQYGCFPVEEMTRRLDAGDRLWFTTDGQRLTTTPLLATERLVPYYCFKYGAEGYENWGVSWWSYDPWLYGWHKFIRQSSEGEKFFHVRYPNGTGFLAYPGSGIGREEPVSSIRFEQTREGIEDYEYFVKLRDVIAHARKAGVAVDEAERVLETVRSLVIIPNAGGTRSTQIMPDPDAIPRARRAVAEQIVALARRLATREK